ncbi:hypothetical protein FRB95_010655 [Tulasnella sp. JGI-2019a]|nr:hypothetical protein FRB95_010655 [Tulasnella sp. JGI-2019a]
MHPSLPPKPNTGLHTKPTQLKPLNAPLSRTQQDTYFQALPPQPVHGPVSTVAHFSNAHGYQPIVHANAGQWYQQPNLMAYSAPMSMNGGYNTYGGMSSSSRMSNPIVNPYAPHINYNILPLNSRGEPTAYGQALATSVSSQGPPGWNGAGTTGPSRCGHAGCLFRGNHKDVEVHRMDRHLIFPSGWEDQQKKRKRANEDDDLSEEQIAAKRAGVATIQGTALVLDTPEAVQAWIAERKKRYPSARRVEEKERALQEAKDRGQILPNDGQRKRKAFGGDANSARGGARGRGGSMRGRGGSNVWSTSHAEHKSTVHDTPPNPRDPPASSGERLQDGGWGTRGPSLHQTMQSTLPKKPMLVKTMSTAVPDVDGSDGDSSSGSDVDPVMDAISSRSLPSTENKALLTSGMSGEDDREDTGAEEDPNEEPDAEQGSILDNPRPKNDTSMTTKVSLRPPKRKSPPQPRRVNRGPFNNRPSLLRNLLLPDIRTTVSNLSQAIRFLVANDFLEGVEFRPGQAANPLIEVVGEMAGIVETPNLDTKDTNVPS